MDREERAPREHGGGLDEPRRAPREPAPRRRRRGARVLPRRAAGPAGRREDTERVQFCPDSRHPMSFFFLLFLFFPFFFFFFFFFLHSFLFFC